jgi:heme A synthase
VVRATGAGAGCGNHWPLCNGEVVPRSPRVETLIEFSHRLSSGLLGLFVLAFALQSFRSLPPGHAVRRGALASVFFVVAEALLGAGLVRFEWVASNASVARVYAMAFHLVNTFLLLAAMSLTAWLAGRPRPRNLSFRGRGRVLGAVALGGFLLLVLGSSGAVTALGDTLVLTQGVTPQESEVVAKLVASRFYHPAIAVATFVLVLGLVLWLRARTPPEAARYSRALLGLFGLQLLVGAVNVLLKAPVPIQILHLAVSDLLWIAFVLLAAEALSRESPSASAAAAA